MINDLNIKLNKILMKKFFLLIFCVPLVLLGQPVLLPHIGLTSAPLNSDPICTIPVYTGEMDTTGFSVGDLVPDFTLYKKNGDSVRLINLLSSGKPVLLVGGNYTCPKFRQKIDALNDMTNFYAGQLQVYVIYGVEAHPINDPSPYSGFEWVTSENTSEGVLFEQPDTYGERINMVDSLLANYTVTPEILLDGPCNQWWSVFGPAPNNAYLIDTNGLVKAKHGWFNRTPDNMWCDIDQLLGTNSGNCIAAGNNGTFSYTLSTGDSIATGIPGDVLSVHGLLKNLSSTDNVEINISKQFINVPADWSTALCADICYAPTVNSTLVTIAPNDSLNFIFYFYTGFTADSGMVRLRFRNVNITANTILQKHYGFTSELTGISDLEAEKIKMFPNPCKDKLMLICNDQQIGNNYTLYDISGKMVLAGKIFSEQTEITLGRISSGFYYLKISEQGSPIKIIKN
jgi:hypothetical protein